VLGNMVRVARQQRTTVLLVTHDPVVAAYADREVVLRDGLVDSDSAGLTGTAVHR
jgi:putative ABC transport system ATP-binding protein